MSTKKMHNFRVMSYVCYLGQNADYSQGGSISDSSERLLQSGSRGESIYKVLVKGEHRVPPSTLNSLRGC